MAISSLNFSNLLQPAPWGNFNCFPLEIIREIFRQVVLDNTGPLDFSRLALTCKNFYTFCQWTIVKTPWINIAPLTEEMQFTRAHLKRACALNTIEAAKQLIQHKQIPLNPTEDLNLLLKTIKQGRMEIVEALLSGDRTKNIDFNKLYANQNPLEVALNSPHSNVSFLLWKSGRFQTQKRVLLLASRYGHAEVVSELLKDLKCSFRESDFRDCLNAALANKKMATATILLKSRRILLDSLGPGFEGLGRFALILTAGLVAVTAITTLLTVGIVAALAGSVGALSVLPVCAALGAAYMSIVVAASMIGAVGILTYHLLVLARATALIAYHRFKQKPALA